MPPEDLLWLRLSLKCSMNALQLTHSIVRIANHIYLSPFFPCCSFISWLGEAIMASNYIGLAFTVAGVLPQNSTRGIMNEEETP